ncbi:hypothetical protein Tco_0500095 [Tanacetum coccineum]
MEEVVSTWFVRSYRKQFEEYMMIRRRLEVNGLDTDVECDPTNVEFAIWGDEEVLTKNELSNLEEEDLREDIKIVEIFKIETDVFDFETPLGSISTRCDGYIGGFDLDVMH